MEFNLWKSMEDAFTMGKNAFYVAKEVRKGYAFTGLESIETYISNFLVAFRKNLKNKIKIPIVYHEIITEWSKRRIYFDIDYTDSSRYSLNPEEFIQVLLEAMIEELKNLGLSTKNIIKNTFITTASRMVNGRQKHSYHVTITGYYMENSKQSERFATNVVERMEKKIEKVYLVAVDLAVYGKNHQLRMAGSHKIDSPVILDLYEFTYGEKKRSYKVSDDNVDRWDYILRNTIIQNVDADDLEIKYTSVNNVVIYRYEGDMSQEKFDKVMSVVQNSLHSTNFYQENGDHAFKVGSTSASCVTFDRIGSSHCSICKTNHDSVGMYVYVTSSGDVVRKCFSNHAKSARTKLEILGNYIKNEVNPKDNVFFYRVSSIISTEKLGYDGNKMIRYLIESMGIIK
jgi:hypothetical protein